MAETNTKGVLTVGEVYERQTAGVWPTERHNNYVNLAIRTAGLATNGQLGNDSRIGRSSPVQVGEHADWSTTSGGTYFTTAIKTNGTLWAWGFNNVGQLGLGDAGIGINRSSPVQVGALTNWSKISGGDAHIAAIKTGGTLWTWGSNTNGGLGLGDTTSRSSPVQVGALTTWKQVSVSFYNHLYAVKTDGTLWSCGNNSFGQLGLGDTLSRSSPVQVGTLTTWSTVAACGYHGIMVKTDGTLWTCGYNFQGRLGLGDTLSRSSPVQVGLLTNWKSATASLSSSTTLKTDGTIWAWGSNSNGQLGLGDTLSRSSPVQVGALTTWKSIAAGGGGHVSATRITTDTLWNWGNNNYGQLGLGDTVSRSSPVQVSSITLRTISIGEPSGYYHMLAIIE
jgi:alpha-tubulin suppressor-like RCC1 family protein